MHGLFHHKGTKTQSLTHYLVPSCLCGEPPRSFVPRPDPRWGLGHEFRGSSSYQKFVTRPLVFSPSRDCRGSFLPIVKKDPHHRRGSLFRSRRGSFPRRAAINKVSGPDFEPPTSCAFLVPSSLCGDRTLRFSPVPLDLGLWTLDQEKPAISIQPQKRDSFKISFPRILASRGRVIFRFARSVKGS